MVSLFLTSKHGLLITCVPRAGRHPKNEEMRKYYYRYEALSEGYNKNSCHDLLVSWRVIGEICSSISPHFNSCMIQS